MKRPSTTHLVFGLLCTPILAVAANDLNFDPQNYTAQSVDVDEQAIKYRAYEHIVYVRNPVDAQYQQMNIYIPEAYFQGGNINGFTAKTAPIFLPNGIGGYMPAEPITAAPSDRGPNAGETSTVAYALAHGYVVASPGARGRTLKDTDGLYTGKAPAAIVDLKAAVRYLRFNDRVMSGDANKIISNGTSAGGAMSALLGASGNSKDYAPYLRALGAANARDDIFAVSAYCPIANLEHADAAYEWQFNGVNDYKKMVMGNMIDFHMDRKEVAGTLTADEIKTSDVLKTQFPAYLNSLKLKDTHGTPLTLDNNGNGSFKNYVSAQVQASAQKALNQGADLSTNSWLSIKNGQVGAIDLNQYAHAVLRMKTPPAFDALNLSSGENDLFGTASVPAQHFTAYAQANDRSHSANKQADARIVKLMNPMNYIGKSNTKTAQNWRIRVGTNDRDTSLAVSAMLSLKLNNAGKTVDYALPWGVPHSGDYDLDELFAWMDHLVKKP